jgi:hypothetical protein
MTRSNRSNLLPKTNNRRTPIFQMQQTDPVVRKTVVVNAESEHAFAIFTKNMGQWWPKEHRIGVASGQSKLGTKRHFKVQKIAHSRGEKP